MHAQIHAQNHKSCSTFQIRSLLSSSELLAPSFLTSERPAPSALKPRSSELPYTAPQLRDRPDFRGSSWEFELLWVNCHAVGAYRCKFLNCKWQNWSITYIYIYSRGETFVLEHFRPFRFHMLSTYFLLFSRFNKNISTISAFILKSCF